MKIAIVGLFPWERTIIRGGVEAVTLRLCEGLSRLDGAEVHTVVSSPHNPVATAPFADNWTVHSVGYSARGGNLLFALPDRKRIARELRRIEPDVVHAHGADRHALGSLESGFPTVVTIHGIIEAESRLETTPRQRLRNLFRSHIARQVVKKSRHVIVISPYVAELYRNRLAHARTWTVENPVGERFFEVPGGEGGPAALFSGLLIPRKALEVLIDATAKARRKAPDLRLRIAGAATDPEYLSGLKRRVADAGLGDAVTFLGGLSPDELVAEYGRAAFLVLPSHQETAPVAIQEAMAAGRPVIGSSVGGIPHQIREGETGFVVPPGDADLLAERMAALLKDEELRLRMGARAREEAKSRFSAESVARRTMAVYREIVGSGARPA